MFSHNQKSFSGSISTIANIFCSYEGQLGAAAITLAQAGPSKEQELMAELYVYLRARGLPNYAIPRLVRITGQ